MASNPADMTNGQLVAEWEAMDRDSDEGEKRARAVLEEIERRNIDI